MIPYILYTSMVLTACFIFYKMLLQKETFFHLNRFILLGCMALAFVLPMIHVPQEMSFRKVQENINNPLTKALPGLNDTAEIKEDSQLKNVSNQQTQGINFDLVKQWLIYLYWFGVIIFGSSFLMQAIVLLYTAYSRPVIKDGKFRIVEISGDKAPCSFGSNIFINPAKYDWETYNQVLLHEKIHIQQQHTLDLLLAEMVLIFQWFNPFAWLWRKELEGNLEFLTDNTLLEHGSVEKESYQLSLLKVTAPHFPLSLTTNYNQSLLKKRLLMMNAKKSNVHTIWKYFFLIPLMVVFVCLFNDPLVKSQSPAVTANPKSRPQVASGINTEGNWFATIKEDKIDIQFRSADDNNSSNSTSFLLSDFKDLPRDKPGVFTVVREAGTMLFKGKFDGDKGMGEYKFTPDKNYGDAMHKEGIDVMGENDLLVFFFVDIKRSYVSMLKHNGYTDLDKDKLVPLAALDVSEAYIKSIKAAGFTDIGLDNLVPFKALNIDKAYIEEIRNAGYKDITPDKVITFKSQGIDGKYIADFRNSDNTVATQKKKNANQAGKTDNNNKQASPAKNSNTNKKLTVNSNNNDDDDIIAFKAMKIDAEFVNSFKEVGYENLSNSDLISLKALNVTPGYIKSFQNAGYKNIKTDELVSLKAQNVTPEIIKQYKDLGFDQISLDDVIGAKATGTSPAFIQSMREKGHDMKSLDKYIALKSVLGN